MFGCLFYVDCLGIGEKGRCRKGKSPVKTGRESDGFVVPKKRANKASLLAAEFVEGRESTEGNATRTMLVPDTAPGKRGNGFQYREDAERCLRELRGRLEQFGLQLHPEKTRLIEFGRYASERRSKRGQGKPET